MIITKSCPRCHGDMLREELLGEVEMVCIQCGHRAYPEAEVKRFVPSTRTTKKAA